MDEAWEEEVRQLASAYDTEGLDALAAQDLTDEQKRVLAEDGYLSFANELEYHLACGKLSKGSADFILELVEQAERLLGEPRWVEKGRAYEARSEDADEPGNKRELGLQALDAYTHADEGAHIASMSYALATLDPVRQLEHWERALERTLREPPEQRVWWRLVRIVYTPLEHEQPSVTKRRSEERARFENEPAHGSFVDIEIARAFEEHTHEPFFATVLDRAIAWPHESGTDEQVRTASHLLEKYERAWARATEVYAALCVRHPRSGYDVTCVARMLERRGLVDDALAMYATRLDVVGQTFSAASEYAAFLVRAQTTASIPPSLEVAKRFAQEAEKMGDGYYAEAGIVLARIAVSQGNAVEARFHLERLLLLHELCIDNRIEELDDVTEPATRAFLDETLAFMRAARPGYYLDPCVRWAELVPMSIDEVHRRWTDRMAEILARPPRE